jgi:hypothetical protein
MFLLQSEKHAESHVVLHLFSLLHPDISGRDAYSL